MRLRLSIALAAVAMLAVPATARGYIFWMSYDSNHSRVGRANLGATGVNGSLVPDVYYSSGSQPTADTSILGRPGAVRIWPRSAARPSTAAKRTANSKLR